MYRNTITDGHECVPGSLFRDGSFFSQFIYKYIFLSFFFRNQRYLQSMIRGG